MKTPPVPGWIAITSREPVQIPDTTGKGMAETIWKDVPAWKDPETDEIFWTAKPAKYWTRSKLAISAFWPPIKSARCAVPLVRPPKGMAELLQLGEKSWTRWETGVERPSRSMNVLLCAVYDGKIDVGYLRALADPALSSRCVRGAPDIKPDQSVPAAQMAETQSGYGEKPATE